MELSTVCRRRILQRLLIFLTLWVTGTIGSAAEAFQFEVEFNNTSTSDDDYFCWTPIPARMRMLEGTEPVSVVLSSRSGDGGGEVVFQTHDGTRPTSSDFSGKDNIILTLGKNEAWLPFWVAGHKASIDGKDTEIVVTGYEDGVELESIPVMVRVRKDASTLTRSEISRFLEALSSLHNNENGAADSRYLKYAEAHEEAFGLGIHRSYTPPYPPLFLVWHRALLLSIERELQAIDPTIAMPYWRFDRDDIGRQQIFSVDFMGTIKGGDRVQGGRTVQFSQENPLDGWVVATSGGSRILARTTDGTKAVVHRDRLQQLFEQRDLSGDLVHVSYKEISRALEFRYHNGAHSEIGGVLRSAASPGDPLFFLLHANVDRAWAQWQHSDPAVRFDPTHVDAYSLQGAYPGTSVGKDRFRIGSYANDTMWPWGGYSGRQDNEDPLDDWPEVRFDLLPGPGVGGLTSRPTPATMIDYLDVRGTGAGTHACYDHLTF